MVLQEHLAPTAYNLSILKALGLTRFVLTLRDPRDVICSLAHHLHRDAAMVPWHVAMTSASGLITESFYDLPWEKKLDVLITNAFPTLQLWIAKWMDWLDDPDFDICFVRYEEFAKDNEATVLGNLAFYKIAGSIPVSLPLIDTESKQIDLATHFRKGRTETYKQELTSQQIKRVNDLIDRDFFNRMGW